ncbi:50S ribosomal protein L1 [Candidatus Gracilibacteria bacterium]|nr:50S ribosomal protein L1 [Candidatus Gracilibacteria bacterium]
MKKYGKKYKAALEKISGKENLSLNEAADLVVQTSTTKFDSSVELHMNLGVDPKHADQIVRGVVVLPHGTGKTVRVAAFVSDENKDAAKKAGADLVGIDDLVEQVSKGKIDFDIAVATPDAMKSLGKIARTLGQKGLMPNPKAGTVTQDFEKAIGELKKGRVEFKTDKTGIIHVSIGKVSFGGAKILENLKTIMSSILDKKPASIKNTYVNSVSLATTMGPGVSIDVNEAYSVNK